MTVLEVVTQNQLFLNWRVATRDVIPALTRSFPAARRYTDQVPKLKGYVRYCAITDMYTGIIGPRSTEHTTNYLMYVFGNLPQVSYVSIFDSLFGRRLNFQVRSV